MVKHLSAGSTDVPVQPDKLRIYSMRYCPYAQRAHLVLYAKKIPHDIVYINLKTKPEWYLARVPTGKVPALFTEGVDLFESLIIADYLDEKYPTNKLYPDDPLKKAQDRILIEQFTQVLSAMYKLYLNPEMDLALLEPVFCHLDHFEKTLNQRSTRYFSGDKPGMVDYMIWPWCERLEMVRVLGGDDFKVPKDRFPKFLEWCKDMLNDEAVKLHFVTPEVHAEFLKSHKAGAPNYDM